MKPYLDSLSRQRPRVRGRRPAIQNQATYKKRSVFGAGTQGHKIGTHGRVSSRPSLFLASFLGTTARPRVLRIALLGCDRLRVRIERHTNRRLTRHACMTYSSAPVDSAFFVFSRGCLRCDLVHRFRFAIGALGMSRTAGFPGLRGVHSNFRRSIRTHAYGLGGNMGLPPRLALFTYTCRPCRLSRSTERGLHGRQSSPRASSTVLYGER